MARKKEKKAAPKTKNTASKKAAAYEDADELETVENEASEEESTPKAKKSRGGDGGSVYKVIEVIGSSSKSWEHAAQVAVERASQTLEDLRVAEVIDQDLKIEDGAISAYRTKLRLSFKFRE